MSSKTRDVVVAVLLFGAIVAVAVAPGSFFNPSRGETRQWYDALQKPSFNPPNSVFAPVWTILYILIAIAGARVWLAAPSPGRSVALRLWFVQLALNAVWSPLFFGAQQPLLALVDIVLMLAAIAAFVWRARAVDRVAAGLMLPYLGWVSFATALNLAIVQLNR